MKYFYLVWKSVWRKKVRTWLTILSIIVAFLLYGLLQALNYAFNSGADLANAHRLVTINKVSLINPLPMSYLQRIRSVAGVADATHADWFGGYYQEPRTQLANFPVDPEAYLRINQEVQIAPQDLKRWKSERDGILVGRSLATQYGWKVGDRIPIGATIWQRKDGNPVWDFQVSGIFDDTRGNTAYNLLRYDYFDEARAQGKGSVGWFVFMIDPQADAARVAEQVDGMFENSAAETRTSTEQAFSESFIKQFGDVGFIIRSILGAVFFTIVLVSGNTMAQSVRERIPELAVLKTLGFRDTGLLGIVLGESVLVVLLGGVIGLGLAMAILSAVAEQFASVLPNMSLTDSAAIQAILIMLGLGVFTGVMPAMTAMRLSIVDALGRR